jgi:hypothetical protein
MEILADYTFRYKSGFWQNLVMTFPEIPNAKNVVNKLSFSLVTHMGYSDARFGSYGIFEVRTRYWTDSEQTGQKDEEPGFKSRIRVNLDKGCKQIS